MKFLCDYFRDFRTDWRRGFVFAESKSGPEPSSSPDTSPSPSPDKDATPAVEKEKEKPRKKDLIDFSYKDVQYLDKNPDKVKEEWGLEKFRSIVEHYLRIAEGDDNISGSFPPRIIYALHVSKTLKNYLKRQQVDRIERIFDQERVVVKTVSDKSVDTWSDKDLIRAVAFYEGLKAEKKRSKNDQILFQTLNRKILEKGVLLLHHYSVRRKQDQTFTLKNDRERLILLEVLRIFPEPHDWIVKARELQKLSGKEEDSIKKLLTEVSRKIAHHVLAKKNQADFVFFWDTLDDLIENGAFFADLSEELRASHKNRLRTLVRRNNAAQFVSWANNQAQLQPEQVLQLQNLAHPRLKKLEVDPITGKETRVYELPEFPIEEFDRHPDTENKESYGYKKHEEEQLQDKIKKAKKQLQKLKGDKARSLELDDEDFLEYLDTFDSKDEAEEVHVTKKTLEEKKRIYKDIKDEAKLELQKGLAFVKDFVEGRYDSEFTSQNVAEKVKKLLERKLRDFKLIFEDNLQDESGNIDLDKLTKKHFSSEQNRPHIEYFLIDPFNYDGNALTIPERKELHDVFETFLSPALSGQNPPGKTALAHFRELKTKFSNFYKAKEEFDKSLRKAEKSIERKLKESQDSLKEVKEKLKGMQPDPLISQEYLDALEHVHDRAVQAVENYSTELGYRYNNRALTESDFELLFRVQFDDDPDLGDLLENEIPTEGLDDPNDRGAYREFALLALGEDKVRTIQTFRPKVRDIIKSQLRTLETGADRLDPNNFDETEWLERIEKAFGTKALSEKIATEKLDPSDTKTIWERLEDMNLDISEFISGMVLYFRFAILKVIEDKVKSVNVDSDGNPVDDARKTTFLNNISRFHTTLRSTADVHQIADRKLEAFQKHQFQIDAFREEEKKEVDSFVDEVLLRDGLRKIVDEHIDQLKRKDPKFIVQPDAIVQQIIRLPYDPQAPNGDKDLEDEIEKLLQKFKGPGSVPSGLVEELFKKRKSAEQVREAFRENDTLLTEGFTTQDEDGNDVYVPGTDKIYELEFQTSVLEKDIGDLLTGFQQKISGIRAKLLQNEQGYTAPVDVPKHFREMFRQWRQDGEVAMGRRLDQMRQIFDHVFDDPAHPAAQQLSQDFFQNIETGWDFIKDDFKRFEEEFERLDSNGETFTSDDLVFSRLEYKLSQLKSLLNIRSGFWRQEMVQHLEDYVSQDENLEVLEEFGFFQERDEAEKKFKEQRRRFNEHYAHYRDATRNINNRIRKDLNRLNEEDFAEKYKTNKENARSFLSELNGKDAEFDAIWQKFNGTGPNGNSPFWEEFIAGWDAGGQERAHALNRWTHWRDIGNDAVNMAEKANEIKIWINAYDSADKKDRLLGMRRRKAGVQWISIYNLYDTVKRTIEARERLWKRKMDRITAQLGQDVFGTTRVGKEFFRMEEQSEAERVNEFKEQYDDQEYAVLSKAMEKSKDPDEVRALITLMGQKGWLKWDNPVLWQALMRLGSSVYFDIPGDMSKDWLEIRTKVRDAATSIWSFEVFRQWDSTLDDSAKKAQGGFEGEFTDYETNDGAKRTEVLATMLQKWVRGETAGVDPAKYEAFISFAFRDGKMNGQPDQRWYFLVKGVSTINPNNGEPLLSRAALARMNNQYLARFPHVDFFSDRSSAKLKGRIVPPGTPGSRPGGPWTYEDYQEWGKMLGEGGGTFDPTSGEAKLQTQKFFYEVINLSIVARGRVARMQRFSDKEGDHDDAQSFSSVWDTKQVRNQLSRRSEGSEKNSADFWRTYMSGFKIEAEHTYLYIRDGDERWGNQQFWLDYKKDILLGLGRSLEAQVTLVQALLGNYTNYANRPTVFSANEWKEGGLTSVYPKEKKDEINSFARLVFRLKDPEKAEKFEKVFDYYGGKHGLTPEEVGQDEAWKKINEISRELVGANEIYQDPSIIEKALYQYVAKTGISYANAA